MLWCVRCGSVYLLMLVWSTLYPLLTCACVWYECGVDCVAIFLSFSFFFFFSFFLFFWTIYHLNNHPHTTSPSLTATTNKTLSFLSLLSRLLSSFLLSFYLHLCINNLSSLYHFLSLWKLFNFVVVFWRYIAPSFFPLPYAILYIFFPSLTLSLEDKRCSGLCLAFAAWFIDTITCFMANKIYNQSWRKKDNWIESQSFWGENNAN